MSHRHVAHRSASLRRRGLALVTSVAMLIGGGISLAVAPGANAVPAPLACDAVATQPYTLAPNEVLTVSLDPGTCWTASVPASGYFGVGTVDLHFIPSVGFSHLAAGETASENYDSARFTAPSTAQPAAVQFTVGSLSFEVAVVVPATVPDAPTTPSATGGANQIDLSWSAPASDGGSNLTGYRIDVSDTDALSGFTTLVATQPGLTYTDSPLVDSATRWYRVYAINSIGTSATYAEATATTHAAPGPDTVPDAPASATGIGGVSQATVTWTAPVDDGGLPLTYTVRFSFTDASSGFGYSRSGLTNLSYTEAQLADGQQVWFRVYAVNSLGESVGYAEATATALTPTDVPFSIGCDVGQTVEYTIDPGERLVLNMDPVCHGVRKLAGGTSWHAQAFNTILGGYLFDLNNYPAVSTAGDMTPFRYTAVDDGYGYAMSDQFFLTPVDDYASLNGTTVRIAVSGTPRPQTLADAPRNADATLTGATTADVTFDAPVADGYSPIDHYTVTSSPAGATGTLSGAAGGTVQVTGLTPGTSYTFTVTATNGIGTSAPSDPSNAVTPVLPPPPGPPPANDDIENAVILPVGSVTAIGNNTHATLQQGELPAQRATHTVWFTWTAPELSAGTATIDTCGSGFDTTLAVFAAGTFAAPALADNDDGCGSQSSVTFPVTPGASYSVQVNGYDDNEYGSFFLNYSVAGGTVTPVVPTPTPGGGGSSSSAADSGSGSSEPAVVKPVKVPVVSPVVPQAATALIRQTARIKAPSSRQFVVGTQVMLAKKAVKTSAGVTVRWSRVKSSKGICSVATVRGRAMATMLKPGTCTVVGTAAAPSSAYSAFQTTRTYRVR